MKKRIVSVLLTFAMVLTLVPTTALVASATDEQDPVIVVDGDIVNLPGQGTEDDPLIASTWDALKYSLNAACNKQGGTEIYVKLNSDLNLYNPGEINVDPEDSSEKYVLDLNGKTININTNNVNQPFTVKDGIVFEIKDSVGGGGINDQSGKKHLFYMKNCAKLTIYGGTYTTTGDEVFYLNEEIWTGEKYDPYGHAKLTIYDGSYTGYEHAIWSGHTNYVYLYGGTYANTTSETTDGVVACQSAGKIDLVSSSVVFKRETSGAFCTIKYSDIGWEQGLYNFKCFPIYTPLVIDGKMEIMYNSDHKLCYANSGIELTETEFFSNLYYGKRLCLQLSNYALQVDDIDLGTATWGYEYGEYEAPIAITNINIENATITAVNTTNKYFSVSKAVSRKISITDGSTNTEYFIRPVEGLDTGTYETTITVVYTDGSDFKSFATAKVTLVVGEAPISEVTLTNVVAPTAQTLAEYTVDIADSDKFYDCEFEWVELDSMPKSMDDIDNGTWYTKGDYLIFDATKYYVAVIMPCIEDEVTVSDSFTATVNGNEAQYTYYNRSVQWEMLYIYYVFGQPGSTSVFGSDPESPKDCFVGQSYQAKLPYIYTENVKYGSLITVYEEVGETSDDWLPIAIVSPSSKYAIINSTTSGPKDYAFATINKYTNEVEYSAELAIYWYDVVEITVPQPITGQPVYDIYEDDVVFTNSERYNVENFCWYKSSSPTAQREWIGSANNPTFEADSYYWLNIDVRDNNSNLNPRYLYVIINGESATELDEDAFEDYEGIGIWQNFGKPTEATGYTVSGTVTSYGDETDTTTVTLTKLGKTTPSYTATLTGNSATYSFANVASGTYTLKATKNSHVATEYTITVGTSAVTANIELWLRGDADGNGVISVRDATTIQKYLVGLITEADCRLECMDVNGDGGISITDATLILKYAVGLSTL